MKRIAKRGTSTGLEVSTSDMATWVMENWKRKLLKSESKPEPHNTDVPVQKRKMEQRDEKTATKSSQTKTKANGGATESAQPQRSNSASHLQALLGMHLHELLCDRPAPSQCPGWRLGRSLTFINVLHAGSHNSRKPRDVLGSALGGKQRLGPAYAHRARRSTVVLDVVAQRCSKNAVANSAEKAAAEEAEKEEYRPSRISFGEPTELVFKIDVEVSRLLTWGPEGGRRKEPFVKQPPLTTMPLKSILRVPLALPAPAAGVVEQSKILIAPPVVQTVSIPNSEGPSGATPPSTTAGAVDQETPQFSRRREQTNRSPPPDFAMAQDAGLPSLADLAPASDDTVDAGDRTSVEAGEEERREPPSSLASSDDTLERESPSKISVN